MSFDISNELISTGVWPSPASSSASSCTHRTSSRETFRDIRSGLKTLDLRKIWEVLEELFTEPLCFPGNQYIVVPCESTCEYDDNWIPDNSQHDNYFHHSYYTDMDGSFNCSAAGNSTTKCWDHQLTGCPCVLSMQWSPHQLFGHPLFRRGDHPELAGFRLHLRGCGQGGAHRGHLRTQHRNDQV